jgi:fructosamine-3-kinase
VPGAARSHPRGAPSLSLSAGIRREVAEALGSAVVDESPVSGGCISPAFRVVLADGRTLFMKTQPGGAPSGLMAAEALSLRRLAAAGAVRVPGVIAEGSAWLALEWLEPATATDRAWRALGGDVAGLHRCTAPRYGWEADNFIGTLPQPNRAMHSWAEFWVACRIRPQFRQAAARLGSSARDGFEALFRDAAGLLEGAEADGPSLLHGDLWSGNVHMSAAGPALIDPACCHGHREVDLAMARLFGGFPAAFFEAYEAEWPLLPGAAQRLPLYQLYYLLVHVNLFGAGYVALTEAALRRALRGG